jgi:hypothetical protein
MRLSFSRDSVLIRPVTMKDIDLESNAPSRDHSIYSEGELERDHEFKTKLFEELGKKEEEDKEEERKRRGSSSVKRKKKRKGRKKRESSEGSRSGSEKRKQEEEKKPGRVSIFHNLKRSSFYRKESFKNENNENEKDVNEEMKRLFSPVMFKLNKMQNDITHMGDLFATFQTTESNHSFLYN